MSIMPLSFSTTIFKPSGEGRAPFVLHAEGLRLIKEAGFTNIELHQNLPKPDWRENQALIKELGLKVLTVHGKMPRTIIDATDPEILDSAMGGLHKIMKEAALFAPCVFVVDWFGRTHDEAPMQRWYAAVEQMVSWAEELDLMLALETMPFHSSRPDERYMSSIDLADYVSSLSSDHVGICVDLNHSNIKEDLENVIEVCAPYLINVHVSDNLGVGDAHLPMGEGVIDFDAVFKSLQANGYSGPLSMEIHTPQCPTLAELISFREKAESHFGVQNEGSTV
jgi:sugar phosphate isomerase/epimerase